MTVSYSAFSSRSTLLVLLVLIVVLILFSILQLGLLTNFIFDYDTLFTGRTENSVHTGDKSSASSNFKLVCYYNLPQNPNQLPPERLDAFLCTHIYVAFAELKNSSVVPSNRSDVEIYKRILTLKKTNPALQVLLSVQGFGNEEFGQMVSTPTSRNFFVSQSLSFISKIGFDGIDLDWEFPSWPNRDPVQRDNFTELLREFREAIDASNNSVLLSVAVAAPFNIVSQSYNISALSEYVDYVCLMSYDYHSFSKLTPLTGPNAPLYPKLSEKGYMATLNVNWSSHYWLFNGMTKSKIMVGVPTYAHTFTLLNQDNVGWNAPASGFGRVGRLGFASYSEVCWFLSHPSTTSLFDEQYGVSYAFRELEWISYDNPISVTLKGNFIKENGFGGAMVYSLDNDDFMEKCGSKPFPLTSILNTILRPP